MLSEGEENEEGLQYGERKEKRERKGEDVNKKLKCLAKERRIKKDWNIERERKKGRKKRGRV